MSIQIDTTHWLRDLFEAWGWSRLPTPHAARPLGITVMRAPDNASAVVIVGPVPLRPPQRAEQDLHEQFHDWLSRFLATLDGLLGREIPVRHLFFTGGGPITLPRGFREACEARGIRIHTVSTDAPPPGLEVFMERP